MTNNPCDDLQADGTATDYSDTLNTNGDLRLTTTTGGAGYVSPRIPEATARLSVLKGQQPQVADCAASGLRQRISVKRAKSVSAEQNSRPCWMAIAAR